jgi:surface polysaccharide O-acyltransferase-like enzyme
MAWLLAAAYLVFGEWIKAADVEPTRSLRFVIQGHFAPTVILESLGVFVCLREWIRRESSWVHFLANLSLGIYLIHPFLLEELARSGMSNRWHGPAVGVPMTVLLLLALSTLAVYLIQRAPFAKNLIGG